MNLFVNLNKKAYTIVTEHTVLRENKYQIYYNFLLNILNHKLDCSIDPIL